MEHQAIRIAKIFFAASFEFDFYDMKTLKLRDIQVGKPIKNVHFIAATCPTTAIALAA
jgi:hypothetical protein